MVNLFYWFQLLFFFCFLKFDFDSAANNFRDRSRLCFGASGSGILFKEVSLSYCCLRRFITAQSKVCSSDICQIKSVCLSKIEFI